MPQTSEEQLAEIRKKISRMGMYDAPGVIMIALWAYGKFTEEPFHPLFENQLVMNGLLIVGAVIVGTCLVQVIKLSIEASKIQKQNNL